MDTMGVWTDMTTASGTKSRRVAARVALVVALIASAASSAAASDDQPDPAPPEVRAFWTEYGVSQETQDYLAQKMATTGTIDALSGDLADAAATTRTTGESIETVYSFPDGSIAVVAGERPTRRVAKPGVVTPNATIFYGNCTTTSGSGWVHYDKCDVEVSVGYVNLGYKVSWEKYSSGAAKITWSGSPKATCYYGACSTPERSLWRPNSSVTQDAVVKYRTVYTAFGNASQFTQYLGFWVDYTGTYDFSLS